MTLIDDAEARLSTGIAELKKSISEAQVAAISPTTLNIVVELCAVQGSSLLEDFFEECFYLCMLGDHPTPDVRSTLTVNSRSEVEILIYSDQRRERMWARASAYLEGGRPFDRVAFRPVERRALDELAIVRNAAAHPGSYAFQRLLDLARQKGAVVSRPGDYLLGVRGGQSEVLLLLTQIELIGKAIVAATVSAANSMLQPEQEFTEDQRVPAGRYTCVGCGHGMIAAAPMKIGLCPICATTSRCSSCGHKFSSGSNWNRVLT